MSRLGKLPVTIPDKVKAQVADNCVTIEGPKGKLEKSFDKVVSISLEEGSLVVSPVDKSRLGKAMHGTVRAILQNMVTGVVEGYSKSLEIHGVGFRAALKGKILNLSLGYSHEINYEVAEGVTVTITENTKLKVEGVDKHMVGQVTADIKSYYPVEPYKGKGVRIVGEYVRRKEGKKIA